jgi:hypothetical protein
MQHDVAYRYLSRVAARTSQRMTANETGLREFPFRALKRLKCLKLQDVRSRSLAVATVQKNSVCRTFVGGSTR